MNLQTAKDEFESYLNLKANTYFNESNSLNEAILYSLLAPAKRIRPLLCIGFSQGFKGSLNLAHACGMSVEMIHTYSLIHDDLPAMDNDDYRRGKLTNHKVYGEAIAILAGDSLLTAAPEILLKELYLLQTSAEQIVELIKLLTEASGHHGMVKGQALDIKFENEDLSQYDKVQLDKILRTIHELKTGSIINWSCVAGLYTQTNTMVINNYLPLVKNIGQKIGLLFQMVDDVLDVTATLEDLGKTPGKDQKSGKLTYTNLYGTEGATKEAHNTAQLIHQDLAKLHQTGGDWTIIKEIVTSLENKLPN